MATTPSVAAIGLSIVLWCAVPVQVDVLVYGHLLQGRFPTLWRHLAALEVDAASVTLHWFLLCFLNSLPLDSALRGEAGPVPARLLEAMDAGCLPARRLHSCVPCLLPPHLLHSALPQCGTCCSLSTRLWCCSGWRWLWWRFTSRSAQAPGGPGSQPLRPRATAASPAPPSATLAPRRRRRCCPLQALMCKEESSDAYMLLQWCAQMTFDGSRLVDTATIGYAHLRPTGLDALRSRYRSAVMENLRVGAPPKNQHAWLDLSHRQPAWKCIALVAQQLPSTALRRLPGARRPPSPQTTTTVATWTARGRPQQAQHHRLGRPSSASAPPCWQQRRLPSVRQRLSGQTAATCRCREAASAAALVPPAPAASLPARWCACGRQSAG